MRASAEERLYARWPALVDRYFESGFESLEPRDRIFFLVFHLLSQIDDGGLEQYFCNEGGQYADRAAEALDRVGCDAAAIIQFPDGRIPEDEAERNQVVDQLPDDALAVWDAVSESIGGDTDSILERLDAFLAPSHHTVNKAQ